jgi:hypothetical protein
MVSSLEIIMKASIERETLTVKLTLTAEELDLIVRGIGRTSHRSREEAGMSDEQALMLGQLFFALNDAMEAA